MDLISALRSFLRISQTRSFSAVAHERGVTQPAISRQLSALEELLGIRLVQRSTQAITLTDEGREFLIPAQRLVDDADMLLATTGARLGKPTGRVRIALPVALGMYLSSNLEPLLAQHPELSIDLVLRDGTSNLIEDGLDLEIRLGPLDDSTLIARAIGQTTGYLVASPAYLKHHRHLPLDHPHDLGSHNCIIYQRWGRPDIWWFMGDLDTQGSPAEFSVVVSGKVRANNAAAVHHAALAGQGVALVSHLLVKGDIEAGRLQPLLSKFVPRRFPIYALYPSKRGMPARTRVLLDYLADLLAKDPDMALKTQAKDTAFDASCTTDRNAARERDARSAPARRSMLRESGSY